MNEKLPLAGIGDNAVVVTTVLTGQETTYILELTVFALTF